ncbi:hypothetical protein [Spongiactinospora sp. 9N601]|uniref:hypothetical protein n=1 Tax=Spongiactinospora sp. 9N601 TaxID=3375149 RepID=UPI0037B49D98
MSIYAPVVADLGYFEAWDLWLRGRSVLGYELLGVPILWWGRVGEILSFISGALILIELVGADKLAR